jgi:hypothetical protein
LVVLDCLSSLRDPKVVVLAAVPVWVSFFLRIDLGCSPEGSAVLEIAFFDFFAGGSVTAMTVLGAAENHVNKVVSSRK